MSKITKENIHYLERIVILIILLSIALTFLNFNRSQSYNRYERIQFESSGATLFANLYYPTKSLEFQEKKPLIIYCHGIGSQRDLDIRIPIELTKRGFFVAALDYQGHGESGGNINNIDEETDVPALAQDCSKLLDELETLPFYSNVNISQIGLIGHSLGGMVVLMNQALDPRFNVTVAWAPLVIFDPQQFRIIQTEKYSQYIPGNLLNETNTNNLLIIMHVDDEALNFTDQAIKAQELTRCSIILITEPLPSGGHQLLSNKVLIESIKWFENYFFNSETINGPIHITFFINYIAIFITLGLLFLIIFALVSYSAKFFALNNKTNDPTKKDKLNLISKSKKRKQILKIIFYTFIFVINWVLFATFFGLAGIFLASLNVALIYFIVYLIYYFKRPKDKRIKFNLKQLVISLFQLKYLIYFIIFFFYFIGIYLILSFESPNIIVIIIADSILIAFAIIYIAVKLAVVYKKIVKEKVKFNLNLLAKSPIRVKSFIYSSVCTVYFIIIYLIFSFSYPFAFMWPSNYMNYILTVTAFPIYFSMEILYRKAIYPRLNFLKSEKSKSIIIIILAIFIQVNLIFLTWSWSFFPSVIFTYLIFLIVIIQNTLIFEHTRTFSSVVLSSFEILQMFFAAVISNALGIGAALQLFVNL